MASISGRIADDMTTILVSDSLITEIIEEEEELEEEEENPENMSERIQVAAMDNSPAIAPACDCQARPQKNNSPATLVNTTPRSSPTANRATQVSVEVPSTEEKIPVPSDPGPVRPEYPVEVPARVDYRSRRPALITLTVPIPVTPELVSTRDNGRPSVHGDDGDESDDSEATTPPLMRRKAPKSNFGRTRTRLLDPSPMTPAIRNQINSTLKSKKFGADEVRFNTPKTPASSTKSVSFEEDDPLDDDSIPEYKDLNKGENPWLYRAQWISLLLLSTVLLCSVKIKKVERISWLQLSLWRWQALTLVILSGRLIASWVVKLFVALIERRFLLRKRVLYFVYGLRKSVKNCIWIGLTLGVWEIIFNGHDNTKTVRILTKVLWCLFTASVSWMLKILILKMAANNFHRSAYFERIQDCLFSQYLLETLSGPPTHGCLLEPSSRSETQGASSTTYTESQQRSGWSSRDPESGSYNMKPRDWKGFLPFRATASSAKSPVPIICKSPVPIEQDKLQQLTSQTVSAWTLRRLMKNIRSKNMTTYSSMLSQEKVENEIDSETEARAAAKQIFYNMARPGQKYLTLKDFLYFLQEEQAARAFSLFEVTDQGHITKKALMKWVVSVYKERRALALTLSDNKTVVAKLHRVFDTVLIVILLIIFLLILGVDTSKLLVFFSSIFIPMVFIFGNMAKGTFEALIFLFIVHPYDVGDRICVDGQTMLVEEMNVMNTILLTGSNEKIYYPNSVLATKAISNLHRSPDQWDAIDFQISANTPVEKLGALKERMQRYIESLPQFWYPDFRIVCKDIEDSNKMRMALWTQHHLNFQEGGERFQRRSNMLLYMRQQLEDLGITYQLPRQEIIVTGIPVLDVPRSVGGKEFMD